MVQSQQQNRTTIGKFAKQGGVGIETVRYYQRMGLLEVPKRLDGPRLYDEAHLRQLHFIRKAQAAGFSLQEIKTLIRLDESDDRAEALAMASERIKKLDKKIGELQEARNSLQRLTAQCAKGSEGPCPILKSFDV
ncbi:MAG: MerR family DNA-binding protein [Pseudomonadales bacterium]